MLFPTSKRSIVILSRLQSIAHIRPSISSLSPSLSSPAISVNPCKGPSFCGPVLSAGRRARLSRHMHACHCNLMRSLRASHKRCSQYGRSDLLMSNLVTRLPVPLCSDVRAYISRRRKESYVGTYTRVSSLYRAQCIGPI